MSNIFNVVLRLLAGIACLLSLSCQPAENGSSKAVDEVALVGPVKLFTDENGKPGTEVTKFDYRQRTLHFRATLSRAVQKSRGRWIFTAKETVAGNNRTIQSVNGEFDGADVAAQISLSNNWPVGTYHVDVLMDEKPIGGFDFVVTGEQSRIVFLGHSLAPDNGKGLPAPTVKAFKFPVKKIHIQVTSKGVDTTEPEVVWRLYRVSSGRQLEVANTLQPKTKLQDSVLKCVFATPKPFDRGSYKADIFISGKKVHSITFQVQ